MIGDTSFVKWRKSILNAAYNKERMTLYLFLPKNVSPPYQTIVVFSTLEALIDTRKI
jgi:hypothetical protein